MPWLLWRQWRKGSKSLEKEAMLEWIHHQGWETHQETVFCWGDNPGGEDQHGGDALALSSSLWAGADGRKCCYSLDCLTAMGATGPQIIRGQTAALNYWKQGRCNYQNEQRGQRGSQRELLCRALGRWLTEHSVPNRKDRWAANEKTA